MHHTIHTSSNYHHHNHIFSVILKKLKPIKLSSGHKQMYVEMITLESPASLVWELKMPHSSS